MPNANPVYPTIDVQNVDGVNYYDFVQFRLPEPTDLLRQQYAAMVARVSDGIGIPRDVLDDQWRYMRYYQGIGTAEIPPQRKGMRSVKAPPVSHRIPLSNPGDGRAPQSIIQIKEEGESNDRRAVWELWKEHGFNPDSYALNASRMDRERQLHL